MATRRRSKAPRAEPLDDDSNLDMAAAILASMFQCKQPQEEQSPIQIQPASPAPACGTPTLKRKRSPSPTPQPAQQQKLQYHFHHEYVLQPLPSAVAASSAPPSATFFLPPDQAVHGGDAPKPETPLGGNSASFLPYNNNKPSCSLPSSPRQEQQQPQQSQFPQQQQPQLIQPQQQLHQYHQQLLQQRQQQQHPQHDMLAEDQPQNKRRRRRKTSPTESALLRRFFDTGVRHPSLQLRRELAAAVGNGMTERQVQVWFQNRRQKLKKISVSPPSPMTLEPVPTLQRVM